MASDWLSIVEYARNYDISDMTVRRRIKTGKLKAELREGKYYIPPRQAAVSDRSFSPQYIHKEQLINNGHKQRSSIHTLPRTDVKDICTEESLKHNVNKVETSQTRAGGEANPSIKTILDPNKLLEFCETVLAKSVEREDILKQSFKYESNSLNERIEKLEAKIKLKDKEIDTLVGETEDLKLLIKILEGKIN